MLLASFAAASGYAETLFFDNFDELNLNPIWQAFLPNAVARFAYPDIIAFYQGESNFSFQSLHGYSTAKYSR
jgi:hypothetical protein